MDFGIFAIAFNIGKLWNYMEKSKKNAKKHIEKPYIMIFVFILEKNSWMYQKFFLREKIKTRYAA